MNQTTKPSTSWLARAVRHLVYWSCVVLALAGCGQPDGSAAHVPIAAALTATPTIPPDVYFPAELEALRAYQRALERSDLDPLARQDMEREIAVIEQEVQDRATAYALPIDPKETVVLPTPYPVTTTPPLGILDLTIPPWGWDVTTKNIWQGWYDSDQTILRQVFAGSEGADPTQGVVVVGTLPPEPNTGGYFPTPRRSGAVQIVAEYDLRLTLQAEDGSTFVFNLATFAYEPTETSETPVPPTSTPTAACQIYPFAMSAMELDQIGKGQEAVLREHGQGDGQFGWLSWTGEENIAALLESLTTPGTIGSYTNPLDPSDRTLSAGDVVWGRPGAPNSRSLRDALDRLVAQPIVVPVWDSTTAQGARTRYHISGFAQVELTGYAGNAPERLTFRYLGPATCQ